MKRKITLTEQEFREKVVGTVSRLLWENRRAIADASERDEAYVTLDDGRGRPEGTLQRLQGAYYWYVESQRGNECQDCMDRLVWRYADHLRVGTSQVNVGAIDLAINAMGYYNWGYEKDEMEESLQRKFDRMAKENTRRSLGKWQRKNESIIRSITEEIIRRLKGKANDIKVGRRKLSEGYYDEPRTPKEITAYINNVDRVPSFGDAFNEYGHGELYIDTTRRRTSYMLEGLPMLE